MLQRCFKLQERGTTPSAEVVAGLTTFMVMSYIIFVNPAILSFAGIPALQPQGVPFVPALAATCLVAAVMTAAMGLVTNYPLAIASGMGLNAVVAFQLIATQKLPWPAAMGVIVLEGVAITVLVLVGVREAILNAIPLALKRAISVGIGLFILFIGLVNAGIVKPGSGVPVTLGALTSARVAVAVAGLALTVLLLVLRVRAALLVGIVGTTLLAIVVNAARGGQVWTTPGVAVIPGRLVAWPDFSTLGAGLTLEAVTRLGVLGAALAVFSIMLSDFFDTVGTVIGIGAEAGWLDRSGRLPGMQRVLLVDSLAAVAGGAAGASSATTYIESAAGVAAGGRTGLTSVVVAICFGLALFVAPLAGIVPAEATAPALIVVGYLMSALVREIPFHDLEEGFPALLTTTLMPFTYSITNGIGAGFVSYVFIKLARGRARDVHPLLYAVAAAFVLYFLLH
ncbi:MAG TPA: NCS2 family permease [Methylomirabilota bacterium]|jgi:AGZA family xanthine/uracil permease-like MFS transporter|nr:NCS2 family permease [Methylomirabilota bacterium]